MQERRLTLAGHLLAFLFVGLLLVGARGFLAAHPFTAALLLAAFVPIYLLAYRKTASPPFLYPAFLLALLAYHLILYGFGLGGDWAPLALLVPIALIQVAVARALEGEPAARAPAGVRTEVARALDGVARLVMASFALWIAAHAPAFFRAAPLSTALALGGYGAYAGLRFLRSGAVSDVAAGTLLGTGGFLFLLFAHPETTAFLGGAAALVAARALLDRRIFSWGEYGAPVVAALLLLGGTAAGGAPAGVPFALQSLALVWLLLGLTEPPRTDPLAAHRTRLPLLLTGCLLALVSVAVAALGIGGGQAPALQNLLLVLLALFLASRSAADRLGKRRLALVEVSLARGFSALARIASLAGLAVAAAAAAAGVAVSPPAALLLALFSAATLGAGRRVEPRFTGDRNAYVVEAGLFLTAAYFFLVARSGVSGLAALFLESGVLLVLAWNLLAWAARRLSPPSYRRSLVESALFVPIAAALVAVSTHPTPSAGEWLQGILVIAAGGGGLWALGSPAALFPLPVVVGWWIYRGSGLLGLGGEVLGLPYLVLGFASCIAGLLLRRRSHRWHEILEFSWFLAAALSIFLFAPFHGIGALAAPLWPIAFLWAAHAERPAGEKRSIYSWGLEAAGSLLALASVVVLLVGRHPLVAAAALLVYALLYGWMAFRSALPAYLYVSTGALVVASFLVLSRIAGFPLVLPLFFPVAAVLHGIALRWRRGTKAPFAPPVERWAEAGAAAGALLFLSLPFGDWALLGVLSAIAWGLLFRSIERRSGERRFLAGGGLAVAFGLYQVFGRIPGIAADARLAWIAPVGLLLILAGRRLAARGDGRGARALYASGGVSTALTHLALLLPAGASPWVGRATLLVVMTSWLLLLLWTEREIFIFSGTLALAMLAYNFASSSADLFGRHLVAFFLYGTVLLGIVFAAASVRPFVRFRRPTLFVRGGHGLHRYAFLVPVLILAGATLAGWGIDASSNPYFCGTCHDMKTYFSNWQSSPHGRSDVACATCHDEPGVRGYMKAKMKGVKELVVTLTGTAGGGKPTARVDDVTCLKAGCHAREAIAGPRLVEGKYLFDHASHQGTLARGPELRCTSCHADVGPERHFDVDTGACWPCHFQTASAPKPIEGTGCSTCHPSIGADAAPALHAPGIFPGSADWACTGCHVDPTRGNAAVEDRSCRHCHLERGADLRQAGVEAVHVLHVTERGVGCDWCHAPMHHGAE